MIQIDNLKKLFQFSNIASKIIEPMLVLSFFIAIYGRFDSSGTKALLKFLHIDPQHTLPVPIETLAKFDDCFTVYIVIFFLASIIFHRKIQLCSLMTNLWGNLQMITLIFCFLWSPFFNLGSDLSKPSVIFFVFIIIYVSAKSFFDHE